jgi:hypothetical protein
MDNPAENLKLLFAGQPRFILVSTEFYDGQDEKWWYIGKDTGQHVFMFSKKSIYFIAENYGYDFKIKNGYILFSRDRISNHLRYRFALSTHPIVAKISFIHLAFSEHPGIIKDFDRILNNNHYNSGDSP